MRRNTCRGVLPGLDLMVDSRLADNEVEAIRQHLAVCPECRGEHEALLRLRAALAAQPRPEMARDALGRLHASLPGERRAVRLGGVVVAVAAALGLVAIVVALPRALQPRSGHDGGRVSVAPLSPVRDAAPTQRMGKPEGVEPPSRGKLASERRAAVRRPQARRPWRSNVERALEPEPAEEKGSVIVVVVSSSEAPSSREPSVALQLATIMGADGLPEASVSLMETLGDDGAVEHIDYAYHPVISEGDLHQPPHSQEETDDENHPSDDASSVGGERGAGADDDAGAALPGAAAA